MVHEIDLLRASTRASVRGDSPVATIATEIGGFVHPKARVEELYHIFAAGPGRDRRRRGSIVGVLTEIDLIEHLATQK
jgi:cystathionine beta-synthase